MPPPAASDSSVKAQSAAAVSNQAPRSTELAPKSLLRQSRFAAAPSGSAPESPPVPPALDEASLPLTTPSRKKKKEKSLLSGFGTGKVLKPVPRKVVRRDTLIEFSKPPAPGYEGGSSSSSSSSLSEPKTVKVFKQGQGHFSSTTMHVGKS